jgi:signal peptidase II
LRVLFLSFAVIVIDQLTKFLVKGLNFGRLGIHFNGIPYGMSRRLAGNFIRITYIENPGMAFGLHVIPRIALILITILALIFILNYFYRHRDHSILLRTALALILAGAAGNLIDRTFYGLIYGYAPLFHGNVVDFIHVEFWDFTLFGKTYTSWPVLNIADLSVTAGFLIMLVFYKRIFKTEEIHANITETGALNAQSVPEDIEHDTLSFRLLR